MVGSQARKRLVSAARNGTAPMVLLPMPEGVRLAVSDSVVSKPFASVDDAKGFAAKLGIKLADNTGTKPKRVRKAAEMPAKPKPKPVKVKAPKVAADKPKAPAKPRTRKPKAPDSAVA